MSLTPYNPAVRAVAVTLADEPAWFASAVCASVDPELFYPPKGHRGKEARAICDGCPVQVECLEYALDHDEYIGIWGGLDERQRRRLGRYRHARNGTGRVCRECGHVSPTGTGLATHQRQAHSRKEAS